MLDKHYQIGLLDKETNVMGKEYGQKLSSKTRMEDPMRHRVCQFRTTVTVWWSTKVLWCDWLTKNGKTWRKFVL